MIAAAKSPAQSKKGSVGDSRTDVRDRGGDAYQPSPEVDPSELHHLPRCCDQPCPLDPQAALIPLCHSHCTHRRFAVRPSHPGACTVCLAGTGCGRHAQGLQPHGHHACGRHGQWESACSQFHTVHMRLQDECCPGKMVKTRLRWRAALMLDCHVRQVC